MINLRTLFPVYFTGRGVSYTCLSLAEAMQSEDLQISLHACASETGVRKNFFRDAIHPWAKSIAYRLNPTANNIRTWTEWQFKRSMETGNVAYLWPNVSLETYRQLKEQGFKIVMERINCHRSTAKNILDEAYLRQGWPVNHNITNEASNEETAKLVYADYVFSPSPMVAKSLLDVGVSEQKILPTSYGWSPQRLYKDHNSKLRLKNNRKLNVLFVGSICVRKGIHHLLEIWNKAGIDGTLLLAGKVDKEVATYLSEDLNRDDVVCLDYVDDMARLYREADIFIFPTLEEGGPQVTYEAMACGVPVIVSPMGAGAIARHGQDGFVIGPYDQDRWIEALRRLAYNKELRHQLGENAKERALKFTWESVGKQRREQIIKVFG